MPKKLERCVKKVKKKSPNDNAWAVCKSSIKKSKLKKLEKELENQEEKLFIIKNTKMTTDFGKRKKLDLIDIKKERIANIKSKIRNLK